MPMDARISPIEEPNALLDALTVADLLDCSKPNVKELTSLGLLSGTLVKGERMFSRREIERFLRERDATRRTLRGATEWPPPSCR